MDRGRYRDGVSVIGVPYHLDEYLPALDLAPQPDQTVTLALPDGDVWDRLGALYSIVGQAVSDAANSGDRVVAVSGDCTTSLGTMAGFQQTGADPAIVWLDAHGDVQTPETTASGYIGAIPLPDGPLYVHVDLDMVSPDEIPGLRFPAPGGPFAEQVIGALRLLMDTRPVVAVGIACTWYPGHDASAAVAPLLEAALS